MSVVVSKIFNKTNILFYILLAHPQLSVSCLASTLLRINYGSISYNKIVECILFSYWRSAKFS